MLGIWLTAAAALDAYGATRAPAGTYGAIVVAGAGVLPGGRPSRPLASRCRGAAELYLRGLAPVVVLTGGVGTHPPAESEVAHGLMRSLGVPESALRREARSTSTEENADEARTLVGDVRVLVVTDHFHVFRTRRVFARRFRDVDAVGVTTAPWPRFRGAMREVLAVSAYAVLGRL